LIKTNIFDIMIKNYTDLRLVFHSC